MGKEGNRGRDELELAMVTGMTARLRVVLLVVAPLAAMASLLVVGGVAFGGGPSGVGTLVDITDGPNAVVATVTKSQAVPVAMRGLPMTVAVFTGLAWIVASGRRRSMRCLPRRLGDVGDSWRALLLGAPPVLL